MAIGDSPCKYVDPRSQSNINSRNAAASTKNKVRNSTSYINHLIRTNLGSNPDNKVNKVEFFEIIKILNLISDKTNNFNERK